VFSTFETNVNHKIRRDRTSYKMERLHSILPFCVGLYSNWLSVKRWDCFSKFHQILRLFGTLIFGVYVKWMADTKRILFLKDSFCLIRNSNYILPFRIGLHSKWFTVTKSNLS
jgi:hypothetical protein